MTRNEIILLLLAIFIVILVLLLVGIILWAFLRAKRMVATKIYNPNKLPVIFYRVVVKGSDKLVPIPPEEVDQENLLGIAHYEEDAIHFYLDD